MYGTLDGILRISKIPADISVIEHRTEVGDVLLKAIQIIFHQIAGRLSKRAVIFLADALLRPLQQGGIMGQTQIGLLGK